MSCVPVFKDRAQLFPYGSMNLFFFSELLVYEFVKMIIWVY